MSVLEILNSEWAIKPAYLEMIQDIYLERHSHKITAEKLREIEASIGRPLNNNADRAYEVRNGVAIIPVLGSMVKRGGMFSDISGMTSYEKIQRDLKTASEDPEVTAGLLNIDSPGGVVSGCPTCAEAVAAFADKKPCCAWTDGMMTSAAQWLGAATGGVYIANDTTELGSIGVIGRHVDVSKMQEMDGVKTTILTAGKFKGVGHPYAPLAADHQSVMQDRLDYAYTAFTTAMAGYRKVPVAQVLANMADGRIFSGRQAIDAGLADGMMSFEDTLAMICDKGKKAASGLVTSFGGYHADRFNNESEGGSAAELHEGENEMTEAELKEKFPALYASVFGAGQKDAAAAEQSRIVSILEMPGPGAKAYSGLLLEGIKAGLSAGDVALSIQRKEGELLSEAGKGIKGGAVAAAKVVDAEAEGQQTAVEAGVNAILAGAKQYNDRR